MLISTMISIQVSRFDRVIDPNGLKLLSLSLQLTKISYSHVLKIYNEI